MKTECPEVSDALVDMAVYPCEGNRLAGWAEPVVDDLHGQGRAVHLGKCRAPPLHLVGDQSPVFVLPERLADEARRLAEGRPDLHDELGLEGTDERRDEFRHFELGGLVIGGVPPLRVRAVWPRSGEARLDHAAT